MFALFSKIKQYFTEREAEKQGSAFMRRLSEENHRSAEQDPYSAPQIKLKYTAFFSQSQPDAACAWCDQQIKDHPGDHELWYVRALGFLFCKNAADMEDSLRTYIRLKYPQRQENFGRIASEWNSRMENFSGAGFVREAYLAATIVELLDPKYPDVYMERIRLAHRLGGR